MVKALSSDSPWPRKGKGISARGKGQGAGSFSGGALSLLQQHHAASNDARNQRYTCGEPDAPELATELVELVIVKHCPALTRALVLHRRLLRKGDGQTLAAGPDSSEDGTRGLLTCELRDSIA